MPFEDETRKRYLSLTGHLRPCYPPQSNVSMAASRTYDLSEFVETLPYTIAKKMSIYVVVVYLSSS